MPSKRQQKIIVCRNLYFSARNKILKHILIRWGKLKYIIPMGYSALILPILLPIYRPDGTE